ncbi:hypothetical protein G6L37_05750 [Agrobacterium rubi]|nr:hypothetical protein [Agrobacterium rubi]NTF24863.1 hypothetical protein [Agrobacterium rubi]
MPDIENSTSEADSGSSAPRLQYLSAKAVCFTVTATLFTASLAYAFTPVDQIVVGLFWIIDNPVASAAVLFTLVAILGILVQKEMVVGIAAVGLLVTQCGIYGGMGWYSFLTSGMTPEGVLINAITPVAASLILASGFALTCCVTFHASPKPKICDAVLPFGAFLVLSSLFYSVLESQASKQQPAEGASPVHVHSDHISRLTPDDCIYVEDRYMRCKVPLVEIVR